MRYPVVIHKDPDSDYGVTVPDLPGCFSAGGSVDEAASNAVEAIECHVEGLLIDGEAIPSGSPIEVHRSEPDFADAYIWMFVDVDLSKLSGKSRRVNVTIPERILRHIDAFAATRNETRSGLIADATIEYIATHSEVEGRAKVSAAGMTPTSTKSSRRARGVVATELEVSKFSQTAKGTN